MLKNLDNNDQGEEIPVFYKKYSEKNLVSLLVAAILWLDIDPDQFKSYNEYCDYLKKHNLYEAALSITDKIQQAIIIKELDIFLIPLKTAHDLDKTGPNIRYKDNIELIPVEGAMKGELEHHIKQGNLNLIDYIKPQDYGKLFTSGVALLSFIEWTEKRNLKQPFPNGLAVMIRVYNNIPDPNKIIKELEEKIATKDAELKKLNAKIDELENDKPNTKKLNSYKQLAMAGLAFKYGKEDILILGGSKNNAKTQLTIATIKADLSNLNCKGIVIERDAISDAIKESSSLLQSNQKSKD